MNTYYCTVCGVCRVGTYCVTCCMPTNKGFSNVTSINPTPLTTTPNNYGTNVTTKQVPSTPDIKTIPETASGGLKYDEGKPDVELIPADAILGVASVLTFGKNKYGRLNWAKGIIFSRLMSAAFRHLMGFKSGEDKDPESNLSHLDHAICNLMMLRHFIHTGRTDLDDRWEKK